MGIRGLGATAIVVAVVLGGCAHRSGTTAGNDSMGEAAGAPAASARIEARSGSEVAGTADFIPLEDGRVRVVVNLTGLTPGPHGLHLHETGDCSAEDASSAGSHWNPTGEAHGGPDAPEHHAGDFGNVIAGDDGQANVVLETDAFSVGGENDVVGRAIIVHAQADDLTTQPTGNSGGRVGCGVIEAR
jgi:Cu-Zn family superoxide dismutase